MSEVFKSIKDVNGDDVKWIDARFSLQDNKAGRKKFEEGHIKGALYWDLEEDLSDMTVKSGRHPLPDKEKLTALFRKSGLELDNRILVYDDGGSPFAARAWWILQYGGFKNSFIIQEGFEELQNFGVAVSKNEYIPEQSNVNPVWNETIFASRDLVEQTVEGNTGNVLLDARSAERYRGEVEPIDPIAGRIPGALNFDWEQLKKDGSFNLNGDVKNQLAQVVNDDDEVIVYCGSGVTAALLFAMLKQSGYEHVKLYVGSYSDWISREVVEVEKG
ncbi:sulfurtransferase [Sporosarcina sp. ACRSL]|uniref:sulfurtransferase n=1 Tax=Sporosarcina sp. ACRSL TaxID=2918215 RepID=UPI001EF72CEE|nr:sulfurtransferase [Sporosarcina sp. ACRSL]MCG7343071.1 sulfurtransferase [Sporosarcina sp. ACRSL]